MIDLKKLAQFDIKDLKSLDTDQLIKIFNEHQVSIINFVLIIGALLMVGVIFNQHRVQDQDLRTRVSQAQDKIKLLKARDAAIADFNNFKSSLPPKINEFELIRLVSDYAKSHHVTIASLSPAESKDMGLYDIIKFGFSATSDDFKSMVLFLREIEKSKFPLRIDSWSGNPEKDGKIDFTTQISAVIIHP